MSSLDILAIHGCAAFLELKNVCQLVASCRYCSSLYTPYLYSTKCIFVWIDTNESWDFLDDNSLVALGQSSVTIKSILHVPLRNRRQDFELAHVVLERLSSSSDTESSDTESSAEFWGRELFGNPRRFGRWPVEEGLGPQLP